MLLDNPANCAAVEEEHLDKLIGLITSDSARYSWYIDVLLTLVRRLADRLH